jgi:TonB family protein
VLGTVHVETQPPGATVTVGEAKGTTPFELGGLALGAHDVKLEMRGYEPRTESVNLTADVPKAEVKVALTRLAPVMGTVDILSTPFGAAILIDGTRVGETPVTELKVKPGSHKVELGKDGYEPWSGPLVVQAGKKARVDAELKAIPKPATPAPPPTLEPVDPSRVYGANEVDVMAKKVSGPQVSYPDNAPRLRSGDRASVSVSFVVTENGDVTDVKLVESGGNKAVDEAVMAGVKNWKYSPAVKRGVKVKVRVTFRQTFLAG